MNWLCIVVGIVLGIIGLVLYLKLKKYMVRNQEVTLSTIEKQLVKKISCICLCEVIAVCMIVIGFTR